MRAYRIYDGNTPWFVRGTTDPDKALEVLLEEYGEWAMEDIPDPDETDIEFDPLVNDAGWYRFNPCTCGEHAWHLGRAKGPGRGNFEGVELDVGWHEVEFESDSPEIYAEVAS